MSPRVGDPDALPRRKVPVAHSAAFGHEAVRILRHKLGLTQMQLASDLGVEVSTVSRWERGHYKTIKGLAAYGLRTYAADNGLVWDFARGGWIEVGA